MYKARLMAPPQNPTAEIDVKCSPEVVQVKEGGIQAVTDAILTSSHRVGAGAGAAADVKNAIKQGLLSSQGSHMSAAEAADGYKAAVDGLASTLQGSDESQLIIKGLLGKVRALVEPHGVACCFCPEAAATLTPSRHAFTRQSCADPKPAASISHTYAC